MSKSCKNLHLYLCTYSCTYICTLICTLRWHIGVGLLGTLALRSEDLVVFCAFFLVTEEDMMTGKAMMTRDIDGKKRHL